MRRLEVDAAETSVMGRAEFDESSGKLLLLLDSPSLRPVKNRGWVMFMLLLELEPSWDFVLQVRERMVVWWLLC